MSGRLPLTVDLSTVFLGNAIDISNISLDECFLPDVATIPGYDLGFHGMQMTSGLAHASAYAQAHAQQMQAVIFTVKTEHPIHRSFPMEDLPNTDYLHCGRLSVKVSQWISDFWYSEMEQSGWPALLLDKIKWAYPERFIPLYPDAIPKFLALPEMQHIKVFVYPIMFPKGSHARGIVHVGATKRQYVINARLRYHPTEAVKF